jgi:Domain of unknown function (DUF4844)
MKAKSQIINQLKALQGKEKFNEDFSIFYPGIENDAIKKPLSELINLSIEAFIEKVNKDASDKDYQDVISKSLADFTPFNLDTEDRERVCHYFEEIMNIIGLESSGGVINEWLYGFEM